MSYPHEATQIRCRNAACPSQPSGGRILMTQTDGLVTVEQRINSREKIYVVTLGLPWQAICPSCGQSWLNPGISTAIDRTIKAVADEVDRVIELRGRR